MIINQGNLSNLFTGFKASFNEGFRSAQPLWNLVATPVPSTTKSETYSWLGQFPRLREWIGDRQVKNISQSGYAITNKKFESTISVKRDDIEDDQYGVYSPLFKEMGYAAATHPDELVFGLLLLGFASLCYDGQYFFDTDHPVNGSTVSN
ncbi:MAG TPA: Mu-like prophage major head subunit gpT family protein, partial [Holophaga sp.]|nr:Mu-like prophage major head subunit gpT family protein [Holophaga sp.]